MNLVPYSVHSTKSTPVHQHSRKLARIVEAREGVGGSSFRQKAGGSKRQREAARGGKRWQKVSDNEAARFLGCPARLREGAPRVTHVMFSVRTRTRVARREYKVHSFYCGALARIYILLGERGRSHGRPVRPNVKHCSAERDENKGTVANVKTALCKA